MKKTLLLLAFMLCTTAAWAQNLQLHMDMGRFTYDDLKGRSLFTTTIENFKQDKWGNTFFFVDMNYRQSGIDLAYLEISREFSIGQSPFSVHMEYNGGLTNSASFTHALLFGGSYFHRFEEINLNLSVTPMYKYFYKDAHSAQLTGVWNWQSENELFTLCGFADIWSYKSKAVFLSEPQFWFNLNRLEQVSDEFNLSLGGEIELSYNFATPDKFRIIPTLGMKWTL